MAWPVPGDDLEPMVVDYQQDWTGGSETVDEVRAETSRLSPTLGSDLEFEGRTPCTPTRDVEPRMLMSTLVVIGDFDGSPHVGALKVREVLAGATSAESITVDLRARRDYETCEMVLDDDSQRLQGPIGRFLVFLRPDEFGLADYRMAAWNTAIEPINDRYLTQELPTLAELRTAVAAQDGPTVAAQDSPPAAIDQDAPTPWLKLMLAVAGLTLVSITAYLVGWIRHMNAEAAKQ